MNATAWMVAAIASSAMLLAALVLLVMLDRMHTRERNRMYDVIAATSEAWTTAIERINNVQTIGTPTPKPVEVAQSITAEDRAQRSISAETVERGMVALRGEYEAAGMGIPSDDELRSEVLSMLGGNAPSMERLALPRD
jgi:hypothetical protein